MLVLIGVINAVMLLNLLALLYFSWLLAFGVNIMDTHFKKIYKAIKKVIVLVNHSTILTKLGLIANCRYNFNKDKLTAIAYRNSSYTDRHPSIYSSEMDNNIVNNGISHGHM